MKNIKLLSLVFLFLFSLSAKAQKKIALIAAISNYKNVTALNTEKDVLYVKNSLQKEGFEAENVLVISDNQVTREGLIAAFRKHLIGNAEPGDVAVFHFSGHGQQVMDKNGDEADGYDEALVCYGAYPVWTPRMYEGEEHFTDDDLDVLLQELRFKIGNEGSVLVMIDACYSGTICRGNETVRGNTQALAPKDYKPKINPAVNLSSGIDVASVTDEFAPLIVFSASKQDEVNYETETDDGESVGSLSFAFAKAINQKKNIKTYRGLFDYIKQEMAVSVPRQTPLAEGYLDVELFGGELVATKDYFSIKKITDSKIIVDAGRIAGIEKGTILGLYPIDTHKQTKSALKTTAEVTSVSDFECVIKLHNQISDNEVTNSWLFVEEKSFGNMMVNIYIGDKTKNRSKIIKLISEHPVIRIVERDRIQTADMIIKDSIAKYGEYLMHYNVKNDNNNYVDTISNQELSNISELIKSRILNFTKARYLKQLDLYNPNLDVELELLPVKKYENQKGQYIASEYGKQAENLVNGQIQYKEGDLFIFKIHNKGKQTAYFQVMDIQPDNVVSILIPEEGVSEGDMKIEGGQTIVFSTKIMQILEPLGNDMFKIIASPEPMYNLRSLIDNSKDTRGTAKSPFEVLARGISRGTRSAKPFSVPVNTVNTNSLLIKTVKK